MQGNWKAIMRQAVPRCFVLLCVVLLAAVARGQQPAPVVSFGAPPQAAADAAPLMSFNFRFAPWPDVLKLFAETAGLTLDLSDTPPGTFNYFDRGQYTPTQALDVLNGYLLPRGFGLVRRDQFLVCVNIERGIPPNLVPRVTPADLPERGQNELLTVVFDLVGGDVDRAALEVEQLLGPQGKVVALKASGSLLVTDIGSNLRLIESLLRRGEAAPAAATGTVFAAYPLEYISAGEAERLVRSLFGLPAAEAAGQTAPSAAGRVAPADSLIQLATDARTNSLLIKAPSDQVKMIEQVLQSADVEMAATGEGAAGGSFRTVVEVVPLGGSDASQVGRALGSLTPRIRVTTSGRTPARPEPPATAAAPEKDVSPAAGGASPRSAAQPGADPNGR